MGIQVAPRISFRQMYDMGLGKSLSYVFVPAYSRSQFFVLFSVVVFEFLRRHMLIPSLVDVPPLHDSSWLRNLGICDHFKRSAFVHFVRM